MLLRDMRHIDIAVRGIAAGTMDDIHIKNLFVVLRNEKGVAPEIREIGHFFAHKQRNTGDSFEIASEFVNSIMDGIEGGTTGFKSDHMYITPKDLSDKLYGALLYQGFDSNKITCVKDNGHKIYNLVMSLLEGVSFIVRRKNLKECIMTESEHSTASGTYKSLEIQIHLNEYSKSGNALEVRNGRIHLNIFRPVVAGFMIEPIEGTLDMPTSGYLKFL